MAWIDKGSSKNLGTAACRLPPRDRDRRHQRRVHAEDREAREREVPRRAADEGDARGRAFRDPSFEAKVLAPDARSNGIGAQFGGSTSATTCGDLVAAPRCVAVRSASACRAAPTARRREDHVDGVFLGSSRDRSRQNTCPTRRRRIWRRGGEVDLNQPMAEIRAQLSNRSARASLERPDGGGRATSRTRS